MSKQYIIIAALAVLNARCSLSFTAPTGISASFTRSRATIAFAPTTPIVRSNVSMQMSSPDQDPPRRRRKRKDGRNRKEVETGEPKAPEPKIVEAPVPVPIVQEPKAESVQMQVTDIRDVVSGKATATPQKIVPQTEKSIEEDDDELEDDEEYEYYYEDENNNEVIVGTSATKDNSLESLLADARKIRETGDSATKDEEEESSIKSIARKVIGNIVTADFFVVCALLAWFLAGIFCSYILKDDTVQIAFNMKFESVVQPALGILMIGAAAGAAFDDSEEEA